MEHLRTLRHEVVIPPHILEGQRLAATDHYPEHVFSMEFDVLLLEEIYRSRIHRICYAHQLHSFDILRDNLLGTKKIQLVEFSILHGSYLKHQDYPTSLHLQHRFVQLLQNSEHSNRWAPGSLDISRLLSRRNKFVRTLKEQAVNNNVKIAFFKPGSKYSNTASYSGSPVAVSSSRSRPRDAPKLGRKPLKDKSFRPSLRNVVKVSTPRKSLPRRNARKQDSYAEQVIVQLNSPSPELCEDSSSQESSCNAGHPNYLAHRKSGAGTIPSSNPVPTSDGSLAIAPRGHECTPTYLHRLAPVKVNGISKSSAQGHLARDGKDSQMGRRRRIFNKPVKFSLPSGNHRSGRTPIEIDKPDDNESFVGGQNVKQKVEMISPSSTGHELELSDSEIGEKLANMEQSLQSLKDTVQNKLTSIELRVTNLEQALQVDTAGMDSSLRQDMKAVSEGQGNDNFAVTDTDGLVYLKSGIRKEKNSEERDAYVDKNQSGAQPLSEAQQSTAPEIMSRYSCHKQSENNASTSNVKSIETEELNSEHSGSISDTERPVEATITRNSSTRSADRMQEKDHPSMLSTFTTRFTKLFYPTQI